MRPIAMKCSNEQFEDIKPLLIQNGFVEERIDDFDDFPYLVNNYLDNLGYVSNIDNDDCYKKKFHRTVFEEWNKDIFLEYCDIKIKQYKLLKR